MPLDRVRSVRFDDPTWYALLTESIAMGITVSEVLRYAADEFLAKRRDAA